MTNYSVSGKAAAVFTDASVRLSIVILMCLASLPAATRLHAQAVPTASSAGILQIGGMFNLANSDYGTPKLKGGGAYFTFDFRAHLGLEGEFHQVSESDPATNIYERTYEVGPRYVRRYGRVAPYAKLMYGRGVFQYPPPFGDPGGNPAARLAYNLGAVGGGLDYRLLTSFNVRADYEYQRWFGFPLNGLTPSIYSFGVAYRFH